MGYGLRVLDCGYGLRVSLITAGVKARLSRCLEQPYSRTKEHFQPLSLVTMNGRRRRAQNEVSLNTDSAQPLPIAEEAGPVINQPGAAIDAVAQPITRFPRNRRPPRRYRESTPPPTPAPDSTPSPNPPPAPTRAAPAPAAAPVVRPVPQELELIDINDVSDDEDEDEDDEEEARPVPRARAPCNVANSALNTANSLATDPLATDRTTQRRAADVHHFFQKQKKEETYCKPCK